MDPILETSLCIHLQTLTPRLSSEASNILPVLESRGHLSNKFARVVVGRIPRDKGKKHWVYLWRIHAPKCTT